MGLRRGIHILVAIHPPHLVALGTHKIMIADPKGIDLPG